MSARKKAELDQFTLSVELGEVLSRIGEEIGLEKAVLGLAADYFGGNHGMILEVESTRESMHKLHQFGDIEEMLDLDMRIFAQYAMHHPRDLKSVIITGDARSVHKLAARRSVRRDMTREVLLFPLTYREMCMGIIYLGSREKGKLWIDGLTAEGVLAIGNILGSILYFDRIFQRLGRENQALRQRLSKESGHGELVGNSEAVQRIKRSVDLVAPTEFPVTLIGEEGSGKRLIASIIHNRSPRRKKPFVHFSPGEMPDSMIPAMFFGEATPRVSSIKVRKGALREAKGGTLFIEDVELLPLHIQAQLMLAIQRREAIPLNGEQEYPVDIRLVVSTKKNPRELIEKKRIRQDLYLHMNIFPILVPPLRDRIEDLPLLVSHFVEATASTFGRSTPGIETEVYNYLGAWQWPGNVTELEKEIRQAVLRTSDRGGVISPKSLSKKLLSAWEPVLEMPREGTLKQRLASIEKHLINKALEESSHNQSIAAETLGISRQALITKIRRYGIEAGREYKRKMREIDVKAGTSK